MTEKWVSIIDYEDHYEVSNYGQVRSIDRYVPFYGSQKFCPSIIKKATPHYKNGYLSVMLKVEQKEKRVFVHRLVAQAFIPNPENKLEVNHKDGNKNNNHVSNLEWATAKENTNHAIESGFTKHKKKVLLIKDVSLIDFDSRTKAGEYIGVSASAITRAIRLKYNVRGFSVYSL